jgi:hypothetical protein
MRNKKMTRETDKSIQKERSKMSDVPLVVKVKLSTFAVACRHQQETSEKLYFRGFSRELRTVFRKTSVGL